VGEVVAIVNYALRTVMSISMFTFIALTFSRAKASTERLDNLLSEDVSTIKTNNSFSNRISEGKIAFKHVNFSYPRENRAVLEDITFTVAPNEKLAIIGATGSGKTSLFQLLPRLYEVDGGQIYIDDDPISSFEIKKLRDNIGYV